MIDPDGSLDVGENVKFLETSNVETELLVAAYSVSRERTLLARKLTSHFVLNNHNNPHLPQEFFPLVRHPIEINEQ